MIHRDHCFCNRPEAAEAVSVPADLQTDSAAAVSAAEAAADIGAAEDTEAADTEDTADTEAVDTAAEAASSAYSEQVCPSVPVWLQKHPFSADLQEYNALRSGNLLL